MLSRAFLLLSLALFGTAAVSQAAPSDQHVFAGQAGVYSDAAHAEDGHVHSGGCNHYQYRKPDGWLPYPLKAPDVLDVSPSELHASSHAEGGADPHPQDIVTADSIFSGLNTFAHLPYAACLSPDAHKLPDIGEVANGSHYDIAIVGFGFDTGTSYRPGARFGPHGIRTGSKRLNLYGGWNVPLGVDPFRDWAKIVDCGDVPVSSYSNPTALKQMSEGHKHLMGKPATMQSWEKDDGKQAKGLFSKDGKVKPRVVTLGGDHTIVGAKRATVMGVRVDVC